MFIRDLFVGIGFCIFIFPGIYLAYQYRMVAYILAENPNMSSKEVLSASKEMMQGNKWKTFVLDLSFILWNFLSAITFGLVGIFYVEPYRHLTYAALYKAISTEK